MSEIANEVDPVPVRLGAVIVTEVLLVFVMTTGRAIEDWPMSMLPKLREETLLASRSGPVVGFCKKLP